MVLVMSKIPINFHSENTPKDIQWERIFLWIVYWGKSNHCKLVKSMKDDALYLDDPKTGVPMCLKVMHQAGGAAAAKLNREHGGLREWMKTVIAEEPLQYIHKITS